MALARIQLVGAGVIAAVVLITFQPAFDLGFFLDDFLWLNWSGRYALTDYLFPAQIIDTYRPLQALQWQIAYGLFGVNSTAYHALNILLHLATSLLLYRVSSRITRRWQIGLVAALVFACLTVTAFKEQGVSQDSALRVLETLYTLAISWPAVPDAMSAAFYLWTIDLWLSYLQKPNWRRYGLGLFGMAAALLSRETGVTLIAMLFFLERWLNPKQVLWRDWVLRFAPILLLGVLYLAIRFWIHLASPYTQGQYALNASAAANLAQYLPAVAFPWGVDRTTTLAVSALVAAASLYAVIIRRDRLTLFLVAGAILTTLPVAPFYFVFPRYLYIPIIFFSVGFAALFIRALRFLRAPEKMTAVASGFLAVLIVGNSFNVADETRRFSQAVRDHLAPFAPVFGRHPTLADDTFLYFLDPPLYSMEVGGLLLARYGRPVAFGTTDAPGRAKLHTYPNAYVIYFDEQGQPHEQKAGAANTSAIQPRLPADFQAGIRLLDFELASDRVQRGEAIIGLLYWQARQKIEQNYTVFAHLTNTRGEIIEGRDGEPQGGRFPTSAWKPGATVVSSVVIPIPPDAPVGEGYWLEVGLYFAPTFQRFMIVNENGETLADKVIVGPLSIRP